MKQVKEPRNLRWFRLTFFFATAMSFWLWPVASQAQRNRVPANLGPQYAESAKYIQNVRQLQSPKSYSAQRMNSAIYRVKMIVSYEPGYDMDLDLLVDCTNGGIARAEGLEVANSRLEATYYTYIINRTCSQR